MTYLGCPLFVGRKKKEYFSHILDKIERRINTWSSHLLSFGGKIVLIKAVLESISVYTMAALVPPISVMHDIEKIFSNFLWGGEENKRKYHWFSWDNMCYPKSEGGLGFRKISDMCRSLSCKLWWNFRTKISLWSRFLKGKYCKGTHPCMISFSEGRFYDLEKTLGSERSC